MKKHLPVELSITDGDIDKLIAAIEKHQLKPEAIYLTHTHIDYVGGTPELVAR